MAQYKRVYHYAVDLKGRLSLLGQRVPLRDPALLDFFFRRLAPRPVPDNPGLDWGNAVWQSPCGRELNLVHPEDTPIVFTNLHEPVNNSRPRLCYAGSLSEPFDPAFLRISSRSGRLYYLAQESPAKVVGACLITSTLAMELSKSIKTIEDKARGDVKFEYVDDHQGVQRTITIEQID